VDTKTGSPTTGSPSIAPPGQCSADALCTKCDALTEYTQKLHRKLESLISKLEKLIDDKSAGGGTCNNVQNLGGGSYAVSGRVASRRPKESSVAVITEGTGRVSLTSEKTEGFVSRTAVATSKGSNSTAIATAGAESLAAAAGSDG